jgi:hypothetical protein
VTNRALGRSAAIVWFAFVVLMAAGPANAGPTSRWTVDGYEQFDEGEADEAFLTSGGEVRPGWKTTSTEIEGGASAWAAVRGADGTVYLGTDEKATIWELKGGKPRKLASIDGAVAVVALAISGKTLYAGTMPGGQIWKIDGGKPSKLADLKDVETVWSLAFDRKGALYAGTGPDG